MPFPINSRDPIVVCVGMITPARVIVVDSLPDWNTGATWTKGAEFVSDDAAIVAGLLSGWGVKTRLVGTALGDDDTGRRTVEMLRKMGVEGEFELRADIETPFEVNISDSAGGRTYYWNREPELLSTLEDSDLSCLQGASMLYVDWYDAPYNLQAIREAANLGVPIMLNLEHGHSDEDAMAQLVPHATICQAVTDPAQIGGDAGAVCDLLRQKGASTVLVTLASGGVVGMNGIDTLHVPTPELGVVDSCGAGATFSAGYIYGGLKGFGFEEQLRFAVAAASLKCTVVGPVGFDKDEVRRVAEGLTAERV